MNTCVLLIIGIVAVVLLSVFFGFVLPAIRYRNELKKNEETEKKKWKQKCYEFWGRLWGGICSIFKILTHCVIHFGVKLFSVNGLMAILVLSAIGLVFYCIFKTNDTLDTEITILTISFTLAAVVPYIIGSSIAKNEIDKIVEKKFASRFSEVEARYNTSIFSLRKNNAHSRRIIANLLKDSAGNNQKNNEWAIGWAAEAIIAYIQISDQYNDSLKYIAECEETICNICKNAKNNTKPSDKNVEIYKRSLRSLLTMHAYANMKSRLSLLGQLSPNLSEYEKAMLGLAFQSLNEDELNKFIKECKISDLQDEKDNEAIREVIKELIDGLNVQVPLSLPVSPADQGDSESETPKEDVII